MVPVHLIILLFHTIQSFKIDLHDQEEEKAFDNLESSAVNNSIVGIFDLLTDITAKLEEGFQPVTETNEQDDDNHNEDGENNDDDRDGDDYENLRLEKMVMMTLIFIHRMPC